MLSTAEMEGDLDATFFFFFPEVLFYLIVCVFFGFLPPYFGLSR